MSPFKENFSANQMINKSSNEFTLEKIYKNLESGMPENKSITEYALPNARQWLGGRFVAIWVLPIALTGIVFEILLIAPTNNSSPFN